MGSMKYREISIRNFALGVVNKTVHLFKHKSFKDLTCNGSNLSKSVITRLRVHGKLMIINNGIKS